MSEAARARALLAQITEERARGQRLRRTFTLVTLGMFLLAVGNVYVRVKNFDTETFVSEFEREASTKVWPAVSAEIDAIAADAVPALSDALAAEASNLMPRISDALGKESVLFQAHVHERMKTSLDAQFAAAAASHGDKLKERFPQFSGDTALYEDLMRRLQTRAQQWAEVQLDTTFAQHVLVLQSINESVMGLSVQADAEPAKSMDDVMVLFLEIMNARLDGKG